MRRPWPIVPLMLGLVPLGFGLGGCMHAQTYQKPYAQMESTLLHRLCIDKGGFIASRYTRITVDSELGRYLDLNTYWVHLEKYTPEQHLRFTAFNHYVMAVGRESITFDVRRLDDRRTKLTVDYLDRAMGFFVIPFAYANPGPKREVGIARSIFETDIADSDPDWCEHLAAQRPPVRKKDQSCELLQAKSCGPNGARIPCSYAGGGGTECVCSGRWICG